MSHLTTDPSDLDRFHNIDLSVTHALTSPQSIYSPNTAATHRNQQRSYNPSPGRSPDLSAQFDSPIFNSNVLSPGQYAVDNTPTQGHRSPSHSRLISAGQESNHSALSPAFSHSPFSTPHTGLGISEASRDLAYQTSSGEDGDQHEPTEVVKDFSNLRHAHDGDDGDSDSDYDSPENLRAQEARRNKEAAQRAFNRRSQNPQYFDKVLPPPEMIEVPTAQDVRFGIKGAKSPGWEDVRRRSVISQKSPGISPDDNGGWRKSIFGATGYSTATPASSSSENYEQKKSQARRPPPNPDERNLPPLSTQIEGSCGLSSRRPVSQNPYANFVRPISVAPDESLKMMRGDRSELVRSHAS